MTAGSDLVEPAGRSPRDGTLVDYPVRFCPHCGADLDVEAFVQEYWTAQARVFHCWCDDCRFVCEVIPTGRVVTHEPAHD